MKYNSIMHIAFYTDKLNEMIDFYTKKLGGTLKTVVRYDVYASRDDRPAMKKIAKEDPNRIFNAYIELAPLQFIELFPAYEGQKDFTEFNEHKGYSHFALIVDDIYEARKELEINGIVFDTQISKGTSETYQMWTRDPDGNRFEIMQFTPNSIQVKGNI